MYTRLMRTRVMADCALFQVNAYYQPSANEMAFPAGVLQVSDRKSRPDSINLELEY
jgi:hypothetical protein